MPDSRSSSDFVFRLPRSALKIAGIAFCAGIVLFCLVWLTSRREDFYRPQAEDKTEAASDDAPLPAPLAAGDGASDMPAARGDGGGDQAQATPEQADAAAPADAPVAAAPAQAEPVPPPSATPPAPPVAAPQAGELAPGGQPVPLPDQPAPQYPPEALRRGDQGTVVVRVDVDATGVPSGVSVLQHSGSRELDQAAMDAVRRWRFRPAQRDGQAIVGTVDVPFDFKTR